MKLAHLFAAAAASVVLAAAPAAFAACPAEAGDCTAVVESGTTGASVDLVIVGDGYTAAERDKFYADAQEVALGLLESETYGAYKPVFNAWALFTASQESGADDPSAGKLVNTAFNASYDTSGIDYLLAVSTTKVNVELNGRFPERDLTLCIVNATAYGGSGGSVAVISLHEKSLEIARHELGHTLGNLADEYSEPYPGFPDGDPEPNVALASNLDPVKWSSWLSDGVAIPTPIGSQTGPHEPIGAYEGARYKTTGVFRPAPNCLMRELDVTFCPVCAEAMIKRFSELSLLIDVPLPASPATIPADGPTPFTASIPALADLTFSWSIDGQPAAETTKVLSLDPKSLGLADGPHQVTLTVRDTTPLVREDPAGVMQETFTWEITVDSKLTGTTTSSGSSGSGGSGGQGGAGGEGGTNTPPDGDDLVVCGCRVVGNNAPTSPVWLLFALLPFARRLRRGRASTSN